MQRRRKQRRVVHDSWRERRTRTEEAGGFMIHRGNGGRARKRRGVHDSWRERRTRTEEAGGS
eukprot:366371-Chlamydomonas_euryale.AAC.23